MSPIEVHFDAYGLHVLLTAEKVIRVFILDWFCSCIYVIFTKMSIYNAHSYVKRVFLGI